MFRLSSSGVRGVRGKPLGSVSEYTCAGPAGERVAVGGRRWQVCAPTRPTRRSPRSRAGGLSGVTVWGQGPLLACAVPVAVTRYAAPLGFESVDTTRHAFVDDHTQSD